MLQIGVDTITQQAGILKPGRSVGQGQIANDTFFLIEDGVVAMKCAMESKVEKKILQGVPVFLFQSLAKRFLILPHEIQIQLVGGETRSVPLDNEHRHFNRRNKVVVVMLQCKLLGLQQVGIGLRKIVEIIKIEQSNGVDGFDASLDVIVALLFSIIAVGNDCVANQGTVGAVDDAPLVVGHRHELLAR